MNAPTNLAQVVTIDLRHDLDEVMAAPAVSELQRSRAVGSGRMQLGRVLVLDSAEQLIHHGLALDRLLREAKSITDVLVVAFGAGRSAADSMVQLPSVLVETGTPVLWLGDQHAVAWGMGSPYSGEFIIGDQGSQRRLMDALQVPEIFDQVAAAVQTFPTKTASPGLEVIDLALELAQATSVARLEAIKRLTSNATGANAVTAASGRRSHLKTLGGREQLEGVLVDPAGPIGLAAAGTRPPLSEARSAVTRLRRTGIGMWEAHRASKDAADGVAALRDKVAETLAAALRGESVPGVIVPAGLMDSERAADEELRRSSMELILRGSNLPTASGQLRALAATSRPTSAGAVQHRIQEAYPDELAIRLATPPPPNGAVGPLLTMAAAIAGILGTLCAAGWPLGPGLTAVSLLATAAVLAQSCGCGSDGFAAWRRYGVAALAGGALGTAVASAPWGSRLSTGATTAAVAAAVVIPPLAAFAQRRQVLRKWADALPLDRAQESVSTLLAVCEDVLVHEWLQAGPRRERGQMAESVAEMLDAASAQLLQSADKDTASPQVSNPSLAAWLSGREVRLTELASDGYKSVIVESLNDSWREIAAESGSSSPNLDRVRDILVVQLIERDEGLAQQGLLAIEIGASEPEAKRQQLISELWAQTEGVTALLNTRADDPAIVQLCSHEQLPLLSLSPEAAQMVCFAPAEARHLTVTRDAASTSTPSVAGVIRLVALRERCIDMDDMQTCEASDSEVEISMMDPGQGALAGSGRSERA